jgi:uncharacterized protein YkwD
MLPIHPAMSRRRLLPVLAAAALAAAAPPAYAGHARAMVKALNHVRAHYGLKPVRLSTSLHHAAQQHARGMVRQNYFAHTSPGGTTVMQRIANSGFITFGVWYGAETIAWGSGRAGTASTIVASWMKSPPHRSIILSTNPRYGWIGPAAHRGKHFLGHRNALVWSVEWGHR